MRKHWETAPHPFDALVAQPQEQLRTAEAALLFARDFDPEVDIAACLTELDEWARRVSLSVKDESPDARVEALRRVLVVEEGFAGDTRDYFNPRNSLLHDVMRRRRGIPITLSVIWLDIAETLNWPLEGIGMPGHFLIAWRRRGGLRELIDPFHGGRTLTPSACRALLNQIYGREVLLTDSDFQPLPRRDTLVRMLNNLQAAFRQSQEWHHAWRALLRMKALGPHDDSLDREMAAMRSRIATQN